MNRRGFTFVEVISCLLILSMGMLGATALIISGMSRAEEAQAQSTALGTAMTVAVDAQPLLPDGGTWTATGGIASGYVNGYFIRRVETDGGTVVPGVTLAGFATRQVRVDVYESTGGRLLVSHSQRLIRKSP